MSWSSVRSWSSCSGRSRNAKSFLGGRRVPADLTRAGGHANARGRPNKVCQKCALWDDGPLMTTLTTEYMLGEPQVAGPLAVFPIFGPEPRLKYRTLEQATELGAVVKELD